MENATKALLMAVGVIIGVLVLTIFIWVFRKGAQMLESVDNKGNSELIAEYNSKFIIYNRESYIAKDGKKHEYYNTVFDIVTACNLAYEINNRNDFDNKEYLIIEVILDTPMHSGTYILENKKEQKEGYIGIGTNELPLTELIKVYGKKILFDTDPDPNKHKWDFEYKFKGRTEYDNITGKINKIIFEEE